VSLVDVIAGAVQIANQVTTDLQDRTVMHSAWIGDDAYGTSAYASPVARKALVDLSTAPRYSKQGESIETKATLTFLDVIPPTQANAGAIRANPIDPRDIITLPDGTTGPIIRIGGFVNADTHLPFVCEVTLGK
jgi:hypothetical protein